MNYKKSKGLAVIISIFLLMVSPTLAEGGNFSIGAFGGMAWPFADEAVEGFSDTEFENSTVFGGSIMYRFTGGFAFEFFVEHFEMDLDEKGDKFGKLEMTPLMLLLKYQGMPKDGKGFTGHVDIGGGINFTNFNKGSFVTDLERNFGVDFDIETDDSFIFTTGAGVDYFFTKYFSLFLDGRFLLGNVNTKWKVSGGGTTLSIDDIDTFYISNFQALLGLKFWF